MPSTRRLFLRVVPVALVALLGGCGIPLPDPPPGALRVVNDDDVGHEVTATVVDGRVEGASVTLSVAAGGRATSERFIEDPGGQTVRVTIDGESEGTVDVLQGGTVTVFFDSDGTVDLGSAHYD